MEVRMIMRCWRWAQPDRCVVHSSGETDLMDCCEPGNVLDTREQREIHRT